MHSQAVRDRLRNRRMAWRGFLYVSVWGLLTASPFDFLPQPSLARAGEEEQRHKFVVDYSELKPEFPGQSGVFRDVMDDPREQFIKESRQSLPTPNEDGMRGFLSLQYILEGDGKYNGYWWKYRQFDDWTAFKGGALVLRLNKGALCTPRFKVEVKTAQRPNGALAKYEQYVWFGNQEHLRKIRERGVADVELPLDAFRGELDLVDGQFVQPLLSNDLGQVAEVVIVFENRQIPKQFRTGELLINQIRLQARKTPDTEQESTP